MRHLVLVVPLCLLSACGESVVGKYQCHGMPDTKTLELFADGKAQHSGDILGHETTGVGTYRVNGDRVLIHTTVRTIGAAGNVEDEHQSDAEYQRKGGTLASQITTCKKR